MIDIYSLFNIPKEQFRDFPLLANRVIDHQIEKVVNKNIDGLQQVKDRMLVDKGLEIPQQSIGEVIKKVRYFCSKNDDSMDNWSNRELRIISYYLMKLRNHAEDYHFALSLLDKRWKNMFFNGLVFYLMNSWNAIEEEYREATCQLVVKKLSEYQDNNKRYQQLKNHSNLFDKNGPMRMAALISAKNMKLIDAPTFIGFKNSTFKQSYYSDVIIKYINSKKIRNIDTIDGIFEWHDLDRTKKIVLANLVEQEDRSGDSVSRSLLCKYINRKLGDVTLASTWAPFFGATNEEAQKLKRAMKLAYMWFAQQIIEVFFEVCVQDWERRDFWLKYVGHLSGFKIVGSTAIKRTLQNDSRISGMFLKHFIETNSYSSQTSALILFIKNKMIVEFSDTGALYVYNQDHKQVKLITTQRKFSLNSTNDLKIPSMDNLVEQYEWGGYYNREEGRLTHRGYWQIRLSQWMNNKVLSNSNISLSFYDTKDDDLFKETPLLKGKEITIEPYIEKPIEKKISQKSLFDSDSWKEEVKPSIKDEKEQTNSVVYEQNVTCRLSSKPLKNNIRIVANDLGFYVANDQNTKYVMIKRLTPKEKPTGSIWVKRPNEHDWSQIIHYYMGDEISIGYIKLKSSKVLYKESLDELCKLKIEFN
jgi:hypothetical protein